MRIFLTGSTGFIGTRLTAALLRRDRRVTALVLDPNDEPARAVARLGADLVRGDVTERASMRAAMAGADAVIHAAGIYAFGVDAATRQQMTAVNVQGTANVLELAAELKVPRSVHVSTAWAFGPTGPEPRDETFERPALDFRSHYERTKYEAHQIARAHQRRGLPLTIVCPNGVVGANDHALFGYFVRLYLNRLLPPLAWSPASTYSLVDVRDLAEGIALATERGGLGETYLLAGEAHSLRRALAIWSRRPGSALPRWWLPPSLLRGLFAPLEPLQRALGLPAVFSRETVAVGEASLNFRSAKAQRELGWTHRSAEAMWLETLDAELALLQRRGDQGPIARLKPLPVAM